MRLNVLAAVAAIWLALCPPASAQQEIRHGRHRDWKTLKTENFEINYCDDDILDRVREVGTWAEQAYQKVGAKLGVKLRRTPAQIFVYRSQNDFQTTTIFPGGMPEGVAGVTEWDQERVVVPLFGSEKFMQRLVEHEFTHQLMFNDYYSWKIPSWTLLREAFIPDWFAEGLAEWGADAVDTWELMSMRDQVLDDRMRHLYELHGFGHLNPHEIHEAYITGHWALRHLEATYGEGSVRKVFEKWGTWPWPASSRLRPVTKKSYSAFDDEFRDTMRKQFIAEAAGKTEPEKFATPLTRHDSYYRRFNVSPRFSPDGKRIAYVSDRSDIPSVYVMNADGSGRSDTLLYAVNNTLEFVEASPSAVTWSPDGTQVAFVAEWGQMKDVYVTEPPALGGVRALHFRFEEMSGPAWSPDGKTIAFSGLRSGVTDIWLGDVATGDLRQLTKDRFHDEDPCWSPDGKSVVYTSERAGQNDLFAVDVSTGQTLPLAVTNDNEITPQFSPDGKRLAYASDTGGIWNVWVLELEGGKAQQLTDVPGGAVCPTWGPDGTMAFAYYRHGEWQIWKMTLELEAGEWKPVPVTPPRDWYSDLRVKPIEGGRVEPMSDRWHLDMVLPFGVLNAATASTRSGEQVVEAVADLAVTYGGVRVVGDLVYLNQMLPVDLYVDIFNRYSSFEERDVDREEHQFGFLAGAVIPLDPYRRITVGYTLYENRIKYDEEALHNVDPRDAAMIVALTHDNVHGRGLNPSGGIQFTAGVAWFRDFWGSQEIRTDYFWDYRQYVEPLHDHVIALRTFGQISVGEDSDATDVGTMIRGYRFGRWWGRNALAASVEYRFPIWRDINWATPGQIFLIKDLRGYVFGDIGYVTDDNAHRPLRLAGHRDWRHSVGGGLRLDLWLFEKAPIPLAIGLAQPTDSRQPLRVTFEVGLSF